MSGSEALRGPWVAVLSDNYGHVLDLPDEIEEDDEVEVSVVRGSATPVDGRCPGSYQAGDVLYEREGCWVDEYDASESLRTRWEQAQAVAQALNALAGSSSGGTT